MASRCAAAASMPSSVWASRRAAVRWIWWRLAPDVHSASARLASGIRWRIGSAECSSPERTSASAAAAASSGESPAIPAASHSGVSSPRTFAAWMSASAPGTVRVTCAAQKRRRRGSTAAAARSRTSSPGSSARSSPTSRDTSSGLPDDSARHPSARPAASAAPAASSSRRIPVTSSGPSVTIAVASWVRIAASPAGSADATPSRTLPTTTAGARSPAGRRSARSASASSHCRSSTQTTCGEASAGGGGSTRSPPVRRAAVSPRAAASSIAWLSRRIAPLPGGPSSRTQRWTDPAASSARSIATIASVRSMSVSAEAGDVRFTRRAA